MLAYKLATSPWSAANSKKPLGRVLSDSAIRYLAFSLNAPQIQYLLGASFDNLVVWAKQKKVNLIVEDIGEGGQLIWMGEKKTDRVILYAHGGCI